MTSAGHPASSTIKKLDDEVFVSGQINLCDEKMEQIKELGIKTIFNIRLATEEGFVDLASELKDAGGHS